MHVEPLGSFFSSLHSLLSFFVFLCLSVCVLHSSLLLSVFVFLFVLKLRSLHFSLEVTVTSLHPPRLCRIAVFSIKPTFLSAPSGFFVHVGCLLFAPRGFRWLTEPNEVALAAPGQIIPVPHPLSVSLCSIFIHSSNKITCHTIRSRGRLPVGFGSSNKNPCHATQRSAQISMLKPGSTPRERDRCRDKELISNLE